MSRQIVFDTETTGLNPNTGDRLVEIGCVEIVDLIQTGVTFHAYINPERDVPPEVVRVHGLTTDFLRDKPTFSHPDVAARLVDFIGDAPIIAHNAPFDRGFINMELARAGYEIWPDERWIDTYPLAQRQYPGMYNSLDALCKRFNISLDSRDKHGALIDAKLLALVYLELNGGRERKLSFDSPRVQKHIAQKVVEHRGQRAIPLPTRLTDTERAAHQVLIAELGVKALWAEYEA